MTGLRYQLSSDFHESIKVRVLTSRRRSRLRSIYIEILAATLLTTKSYIYITINVLNKIVFFPEDDLLNVLDKICNNVLDVDKTIYC